MKKFWICGLVLLGLVCCTTVEARPHLLRKNRHHHAPAKVEVAPATPAT